MLIEIHRQKANALYTEGHIIVNDINTIPYTVEHTGTKLPSGQYLIKLTTLRKLRRRVIGIYSSQGPPNEFLAYFEAGHSYLSSMKHKTIVIGEELIPGCVTKGISYHDRLFDRIEKCEQRNEPITLTIYDTECQKSHAISHWLV